MKVRSESWWRNFWSGGEYREVEGYSIVTNNQFDFSGGNLSDEQRLHMSEVIDVLQSEHNILVQFATEVGGVPLLSREAKGAAVGGYTRSVYGILLAADLAPTGQADAGQWTVAAGFIHETVHHLHKNAVGRDPNRMHRALGFPLTTDHQGGIPKNARPFGQ